MGGAVLTVGVEGMALLLLLEWWWEGRWVPSSLALIDPRMLKMFFAKS